MCLVADPCINGGILIIIQFVIYIEIENSVNVSVENSQEGFAKSRAIKFAKILHNILIWYLIK